MPIKKPNTVEPIIVIGPGRCGTSCVAGVLHQLGVFMGWRLVGPDRTNPHGHWEDCEFIWLNGALLNRNIKPTEWASAIDGLAIKRRALRVPWGWKDPQTCNLLPHYLDIFNDPRFLRCVRDHKEIESSIVRAYGHLGWTMTEARVLRDQRERELDRYLPWYKTMTIEFGHLRSFKEETVRAVAAFCNLESAELKIKQAIEFIH